MSIYGTIYSGTSGLITFSKGLDVISNNVANMNTPGFKRSDLLFRDLFYNYQYTGQFNQDFSSRKDGNGVTESGTTTSFSQGDNQQTGNSTDVAINGNGFFIFRDSGDVLYSRVGQFEIDNNGYLVSTVNNSRVAGINSSGKLVDINFSGLKNSPAVATKEVKFINNLSSGATEHTINDIEVYDVLGNTHKLTLTLTNNSTSTPRSWLGTVKDEEGNVIASDLEIRFQGNGSPAEGFSSFTFTLDPEDASPSDITFSFGEPGSFTGATSFSSGSSSDLAVGEQDGVPFGIQTGFSFTRDGVLEVEYSNGVTAEGGQLALAWVSDLQGMKQLGGGLFEYDESGRIEIGTANDGMMGEIVGGSIEISNVDLSQEFTDLVIVQRGFQVSSQVVSIANEMLQQLIENTGSK
ncbi:flagellar basal-body rod protein FlgF [Marinobacterium sp. D7]|uniref:flagellar basal-body rod protein FlgF n=1 Tax=Marinobacterium ramblicola TaxID=2849041 RepID=UPI001C2D052D|nr:flagellar basal-body rod protein FlgF [Marinobacterium ramblicola]MBV1787718.1 flagellar basal-body rod protein FlgF [Marinobacterium ramblicola]